MSFKIGITFRNHFEKNDETLYINLNLDGTGKVKSKLELPFFDHMLDQIARHGQMDLEILVKGFGVDDTIEDTAIALGEVLRKR
jgi:imidazoleglycerol-phosphate dehydratase/histidinol-phosphatase